MTQAQFDEYRLVAVREYAQHFVDSGSLTPEAAAERSEHDYGQLLGAGLATPGEYLYVAHDGLDPVGLLWLHIPDEPDKLAAVDAFVYDVSVHADKRRQGYGRAIMEQGIAICRARGARALGLNVFGHNEGAEALYEELGFQVTSTQMKLTL
jgi:ribosomal protein S18 acetylase RimI-like enzyme